MPNGEIYPLAANAVEASFVHRLTGPPQYPVEIAEGVHDTPFYDVQHEGTLTDRDSSDD